MAQPWRDSPGLGHFNLRLRSFKDLFFKEKGPEKLG